MSRNPLILLSHWNCSPRKTLQSLMPLTYNHIYVVCAWKMIVGNKRIYNNSKQYEHLLLLLIHHFQYKLSHLISSLYLLYKYQQNLVLTIDCKTESNFTIFLILTSFILTNKLVDDKVYSLQTWYEVLHNLKSQSKSLIVSVELLTSLEDHFLSAIEVSIDLGVIERDEEFWKMLEVYLTQTCLHSFKAGFKSSLWETSKDEKSEEGFYNNSPTFESFLDAEVCFRMEWQEELDPLSPSSDASSIEFSDTEVFSLA